MFASQSSAQWVYFCHLEVVKLVADSLKDGKDGGQAARLVVLEAINKDSKDDLTASFSKPSPAIAWADIYTFFSLGGSAPLNNDIYSRG